MGYWRRAWQRKGRGRRCRRRRGGAAPPGKIGERFGPSVQEGHFGGRRYAQVGRHIAAGTICDNNLDAAGGASVHASHIGANANWESWMSAAGG